MMTIIPSIFVYNFSFLFTVSIIFCSQVFKELIIGWIILSGGFMANKGIISPCSFLDSLQFNSFVILTTEESFQNYSSYSFSCFMSKFLVPSLLPVRESSVKQLFLLVSPSYSSLVKVQVFYVEYFFCINYSILL